MYSRKAKGGIMKKYTILLITTFLFLSLTPIRADQDVKGYEDGFYSETSDIYLASNKSEREFLDLQNEITLSLSEKNSRYVYDSNEIRNIVLKYDFNLINESLDNPLSQDDFIDDVLQSLENVIIAKPDSTPVSRAYPTGRICGLNGTYSIWNSTRDYNDKAKTSDYSHRTRQDAIKIGAGAAITAPILGSMSFGVLAIVAAGLGTYSVAKLTLIANDLDYYNAKSSCGTVLDMNKYTTKHYVFNQKDNK